MNRRSFLASILAAGVAPAAIGSGILMPVRPTVLAEPAIVDMYGARLVPDEPVPWSAIDGALPAGIYHASMDVRRAGGQWERIMRRVDAQEATFLRDLSNHNPVGFVERMLREPVGGFAMQRDPPIPALTRCYNDIPPPGDPRPRLSTRYNSLVHTGFDNSAWSKS